MKKEVYLDVEKSESGWWYAGRNYALGAVVSRFPLPKGRTLDVGAGYGAMHAFLSQYGIVVAYEVYPECVVACQKRGYQDVLTSLEDLKRQSAPFEVIGAFDVLEHIEKDHDMASLLHTLLSPSGFLVATVPAHQFLFGPYDTDAHHFRRYSKQGIAQLLEQAGFVVEYVGYWNAALFLPALVMRLAGIGGTSALRPHWIVNSLLTFVTYLESLWLRLLPLPFGLSILVVARRKSNTYSSSTK